MLRRCLDPQARLNRPDYIGSAVCAPWLVFSNFRRWMVRQNWENRSLDKDLLIPGNKLYSPKTCIFIPNYINNTLLKRVPRQHLPGVHIETTSGRYVAQCQMTNLETGQRFTKKIGRFKTEKQAYKAYVSFKSQLIYTLAEPYKTDEPKLYKSLLRYSKDLYSGKLTKYYKGQQVNLSLAKLKNTPEI